MILFQQRLISVCRIVKGAGSVIVCKNMGILFRAADLSGREREK